MKITDDQYSERHISSVMLSVKIFQMNFVSYTDKINTSVKLFNGVVRPNDSNPVWARFYLLRLTLDKKQIISWHDIFIVFILTLLFLHRSLQEVWDVRTFWRCHWGHKDYVRRRKKTNMVRGVTYQHGLILNFQIGYMFKYIHWHVSENFSRKVNLVYPYSLDIIENSNNKHAYLI
jgi:hypothetical protein